MAARPCLYALRASSHEKAHLRQQTPDIVSGICALVWPDGAMARHTGLLSALRAVPCRAADWARHVQPLEQNAQAMGRWADLESCGYRGDIPPGLFWLPTLLGAPRRSALTGRALGVRPSSCSYDCP